MKKINFKVIITTLALTPLTTFAAGKTLKNIADLVVDYLNVALFLIISLAVVTFVWNVYIYFFTQKDKGEAGKYVMYSVIGFFVILSFWGMVALVRNSLKLDDQVPTNINTGLGGSLPFNNGSSGNGPTNLGSGTGTSQPNGFSGHGTSEPNTAGSGSGTYNPPEVDPNL